MMEGNTEISLKAFPEVQNFDALMDIVLEVTYQNPLIMGITSWGYDYDTITLYVEYEQSKEELKQKQKEIVAEANEIISQIITKGMSDEEKRFAIYDYLNDNTTYDNEALKAAEANDFSPDIDPKFQDSFTTYGIMVKKVGVCASYASVYKMLSDLADIETIVVTGKSNGIPHAWNKVKISNEWYHVDATNNETNSGLPYILYNSNDKTAEAINSIQGEEFWVDSEIQNFIGTDNSHDYYTKNGLEVSSLEELNKKVKDELKKDKKVIVLRALKEFDQDSIMIVSGEALQADTPEKLETATFGMFGNYIVIMTEGL